MEQDRNTPHRPGTSRRRKRTQFEIIKETYLPAGIVCVALLFILICIIGSITHAVQRDNLEKDRTNAMLQAQQQAQSQQRAEVNAALEKAAFLAAQYDYEQAIAVLDELPASARNFQDVSARKAEYTAAKETLVLWEDNSKVVNLSFQQLIADPQRAFADPKFSKSYLNNYVTIGEFTKILQQLYENDYMLINYEDIVATQTAADGSVQVVDKELYLPSGKKPLILTQNQVNYYTYMTDSDGDKLPDKGADGFAHRLLVDENGKLSCEIVNADGLVSTGAYDLVPILESFVATHPDFSYKGAKAILAVTGYDGVFGYRTTAEAQKYFDAAFYQQQLDDAATVIEALKNAGYRIACYTYGNVAYGTADMAEISTDLQKWAVETLPLLGEVDMLVYARNSDISNTGTVYSGEKFEKLLSSGFRYFIGFCDGGTPWLVRTNQYARQGRLMVTGGNIKGHPNWFTGMFDAGSVLESSRNVTTN